MLQPLAREPSRERFRTHRERFARTCAAAIGAGGLVRLYRARLVALLPAIAATLPLCAATPPETEATEPLDETASHAEESPTFRDQVTVTAARAERPLDSVPASVGVTDRLDLQATRAEALDEALAEIPGVAAQSNDGASDVKLSIRGFGARSTFGVRDVLVLVDGVPITDADGFTRLDQVDLAAAERVEVVKGPASALYGNAAFGGVLNILTESGTLGEHGGRLSAETGELGFSKWLASASGGFREQRVAYSLFLSDSALHGFREHNDTDTARLNGTVDWYATDSTTVRGLLNVSRMRDEIPGSLDRAQLEADPEQVRPVFTLFDHRRDDDRARAGAVMTRQLGRDAELEARLFALRRDLDHPIFQVIFQEGDRWLGGVRYGRAWSRPAGGHRLLAGVDLDREDIDHERHRNVFGAPGGLLLSQDEVVESAGAYLQDELRFGERVVLTLGARWDRIQLDVRERAGSSPVETRTFEEASPKLGVLVVLGRHAKMFASVATAFQVPTKSELTATGTDETFNVELEPQRARHVELGVRGDATSRLRYQLSVFRTEVEDEILPRTVIENVTVFGNVAETLHQGAELSLDALLPGSLEASAGWGWSDNELTDFAGFDGNVLPGHPEHRGFLRVSTRRSGPVNGSLSWEYNGAMFLNDANSEHSASFSLLHASVRADFERFSLFAHARNLTDETYAAWIQVNDPGGFYFLPAPGRSLTGGVEVRFR